MRTLMPVLLNLLALAGCVPNWYLTPDALPLRQVTFTDVHGTRRQIDTYDVTLPQKLLVAPVPCGRYFVPRPFIDAIADMYDEHGAFEKWHPEVLTPIVAVETRDKAGNLVCMLHVAQPIAFAAIGYKARVSCPVVGKVSVPGASAVWFYAHVHQHPDTESSSDHIISVDDTLLCAFHSIGGNQVRGSAGVVRYEDTVMKNSEGHPIPAQFYLISKRGNERLRQLWVRINSDEAKGVTASDRIADARVYVPSEGGVDGWAHKGFCWVTATSLEQSSANRMLPAECNFKL